MPGPYLVIVHGSPATGKTTIARFLAEQLSLPLVTKDDIKERLFESLGWSDRAWSRKVGAATYSILIYVVEQQLRAGACMIVESNFSAESDSIFEDLAKRVPFEAVQIICQASRDVVLERFSSRQARGLRHPGHVDTVVVEEMRSADHAERTRPLPIGGEVIELDTDDFERLDLGEVAARVSKILGPRTAEEAKTPEQ